jgi:pimeloyl-ACP methyl ester carboxylesterase
VVFVGGAGTPAAMFAPLLALLDGFTRHAVDLPGHGLTAARPEICRRLRPSAVAFLEQVLDGLGLERAAFVGNSMGALWSSWLALDRPHRVAALVHVGCPAVILGSHAPLPLRLLSVGWMGRLLTRLDPPSPAQVDRLIALVREERSAGPEVRDLLLACERLPGHRESLLAYLGALLRPWGARRGAALTAAQLAGLTRPVQILWGEDDPFGSVALGRRAAAAIPDCVFHVVPGGHAPYLGAADRVAALAAPFLRRHLEGPTDPA